MAVNSNTVQGYITALRDKTKFNPKNNLICVVIIKNAQFKKEIKRELDSMGVPSQFILYDNARKAKRPVISNLIKQINAKVQKDLYRLNLPYLKNTMVVGVDLTQSNSQTIFGLTASYNQYCSQYFSKVVRLPMPSVADVERLAIGDLSKREVRENRIAVDRAETIG